MGKKKVGGGRQRRDLNTSLSSPLAQLVPWKRKAPLLRRLAAPALQIVEEEKRR